jgi:hypothetical protein
MKKYVILLYAALSCSGVYAESGYGAAEILDGHSDSRIPQMESMSDGQSKDTKAIEKLLAPADMAPELYRAYVANGYEPMHAMMLTNWDVSDALRTAVPGIPENAELKEKVKTLRSLYHPVK